MHFVVEKCFKNVATALGTLLLAGTVLAQTYPSKPVTLLVPYPAGGVSDVIARTVNNTLGKNLGQPVIIDNIVTGYVGTAIDCTSLVTQRQLSDQLVGLLDVSGDAVIVFDRVGELGSGVGADDVDTEAGSVRGQIDRENPSVETSVIRAVAVLRAEALGTQRLGQ